MGRYTSVFASPAIGVDGTVYVGCSHDLPALRGVIYALNGETGQKQWEFAIGCWGSSPAIGVDGTVYVGSLYGTLYALSSSSVGGLASSPWPKFRGNAQNTGRVGAGEPGQPPTLVAEPEDATVVAGTSVSFAVTANGTGSLAYSWRKDDVVLVEGGRITGVNTARLSITEVLASDAGRYQVVVANRFGSVTSRNAVLTIPSNGPGQKLWEFQTGGEVHSSPAIGADGMVYVGSNDNNVYALDGATGQKLWAFQAGGFVWSSPAIGADGTVYVGSFDNKVYALNGTTGQKLWEFQTGDWVVSSVIGADGTVYAGSYDSRLYALNGATGQKRWEFQTLAAVPSCPAIGSDGTVYVGGGDRKIYAVNGAAGWKRWEFQTRDIVYSSPAIGADGTVYEGSNDGKVYALNAATGQKRWEFQTGGFVYSSPAIGADGTVYVGSNDNKVYALDGATGQKLWEFQTARPVSPSPAIGKDGTVYVGSWDGKVYALSSSSVGGLARSSWPKFLCNAQNTGQRRFAPTFLQQPSRVVLPEGAPGQITMNVAGVPQPGLTWYLNGQPIPGATQATLTIPSVTRAAEGLYTLVASNSVGQVTSEPIPAVVSNVDPLSFVGLKWEGGSGRPVSLEATAQIGPAAAWHSLSSYPSSTTAQLYVEFEPADTARFYRLNGVEPLRFSAAGLLNGWWLTEPVGTRVRVEMVTAVAGWTNWQVLTNLTMPESPYLFFDPESLDAPERVYRTTVVP